MTRLVGATFAVLVVAVAAAPAAAWSVGTGGIDPCHESFTGRAHEEVALRLPGAEVELPRDGTWRKLSDTLLEQMEIDPAGVDDAKRFVLVSLVVGARAPDTDGHSLFNMESLRKIHADPSAVGQYAHSLRGPDDDGFEGDAAAVAGTRQVILELVDEAAELLARPADEQLMKTTVYLDFYGLVELRVWAPMYKIGFAGHTLQDSFSHAIRTEGSGFARIAHVMNYIDAISDDFDEERDGMAHSDAFDECLDPEMAPVVAAVDRAMADFFRAVNDELSGTDPDAVRGVLDEWITLEHGCHRDNDFCDNKRWADLARTEQSGPYLAKIFGCSTCPGVGSGAVPWLSLVLLALAGIIRGRCQSR